MRILILGGTRFVGRHIVEHLVRCGRRVVCFHRGQTVCELPAGVEERLGDRDVDLAAVATERWDAIVDTCCYRPEQIRRSLELSAGRYLLISTVSVYQDVSSRGVSEDAPTIDAFDPSDAASRYGGEKAACERLLRECHPQQNMVLRPGLIAGKWDYGGLFTYWCERFLRGGSILAPGDPGRFVQLIDAADIARFVEHALSNDLAGTFNLVGPAQPTTMAQLLTQCELVAAERGAPSAKISWLPDEFLLANGVEPWMELPFWLPDRQSAGLLQISNEQALAAGLELRDIAETARSVLDWSKGWSQPSRAGLSAEREAELLMRAAGAQAT
jgi:2'-hydroxyisoflavone reductase